MATRRPSENHPTPTPTRPRAPASPPRLTAPTPPALFASVPRPTPLLPILALMNGSALLALTLLVAWPATFNVLQQLILLLSLWLLVNLLAVVLVRLIDSGRSGAATMQLSKDQATLRVNVDEAEKK